jgi:hypothetical protein
MVFGHSTWENEPELGMPVQRKGQKSRGPFTLLFYSRQFPTLGQMVHMSLSEDNVGAGDQI